MKLIINVIGLPGSGKTTFADMIAGRLGAARVNADYVRTNVNDDLGFSEEDRIKQARRMGHISNLALSGSNRVVVTDFVSPTNETRRAFVDAAQFSVLTIWMNTISAGRFHNTNEMFEAPRGHDLAVTGWRTIDELNVLAYEFSKKIKDDLENSLRRYHIRFNTLCNKDPSIQQKWRIFDVETGTEQLARSFHISGSHIMPGRSYDDKGIEKWNIEIRAALFWEGEHAYFVSN